MAEELPPLMLEFRANFAHLESALKKVEGDLKHMGETAEKANAKTIAGGMVLGNLFQSVATKAFQFGKETLTAYQTVAGETRKLQRVLGGTAEDMSALRAVGDRFGIGVDGITRSFRQLAVHMVKGDQLTKAFGISLTDSNGRQVPFMTNLGKLADRFKDMPNGLAKTALAQQLFGRNATQLLPILNQGADGIKRYGEEAKKAGLVMSEQDLQATKDFSMKMADLHEAVQGAQVSIGRVLLPYLTQLADWVKNSVVPAIEAFTQGLAGKGNATDSINEMGRWVSITIGVLWKFRDVLAVIGTVTLAVWSTVKIVSAAKTIIATIEAVRAAYTALSGAEALSGLLQVGGKFGLYGALAAAIVGGTVAFSPMPIMQDVRDWLKSQLEGLTSGISDMFGAGLSLPKGEDLSADFSKYTARTQTHTKAVKEHAKAQKDLNAAQKEQLDLLRQQNALLVQNRNLSYLAFQAQAQNLTYVHGGNVTVPVSIDGREVFRAVQKQSLLNNRRNTTNGLALSGSVV